MCFVELFYFDVWILGVMTLNVQLELVADTLRVDGCSHSVFSLVEQSKHGVINIVVDEHYFQDRAKHGNTLFRKCIR